MSEQVYTIILWYPPKAPGNAPQTEHAAYTGPLETAINLGHSRARSGTHTHFSIDDEEGVEVFNYRL